MGKDALNGDNTKLLGKEKKLTPSGFPITKWVHFWVRFSWKDPP